MALPIFCDAGSGPDSGINTAIGCIPINSSEAFIKWLLPVLVGIIGGIAFLLMVYGAIQVLTSAGDPQKVKAGQETITSAITGLLFAIFSLFLLRLIGIEILHIPGLQ